MMKKCNGEIGRKKEIRSAPDSRQQLGHFGVVKRGSRPRGKAMQRLVGFITLVALGLMVPQVHASFAAVPLEVLVDDAAVIVQGKVVKIEDAKVTRKLGNMVRKYDAAVIEVAAVL